MVRPSPVVPPMTEASRSLAVPDAVGAETRDPRRAGGHDRSNEAAKPGRVEPAPAELAPLIRSKIQPPALRSSTLSRRRLLDRLTDAISARVTLVTAEAGYGKTTLLADFAAHSGVRTLWYRLDSTDADHVTWTNYLIAAAREVVPDFGRATLGLLTQLSNGGPPKSTFIASLIGELPQLGDEPTLLVLDDFHLVDANTDVRELVGRLVDQAPDWLRFVIASRRRPSIEFARLAGMGELTEISTDELRFSPTETERLFADGYEQPLEADVLRDLDRRTRGWAASLQLFHGSIRGRPATAVRALARSLSGANGPIYDFLAEEVLANIPADLADFLVRAALLERVVAGHMVALLADVATPPSVSAARSWIEDADRMGLLTRTSETSEARQLHPLLRDFLMGQLEQRLDADHIKQMHLRLARTISDSDPLTACRHFIEGGEHGEAMDCLGASVMLTMGSGQWGVASELIDRLKGVPANPAVAAIRARRLIEDGDLTGAERLLRGADVSTSPPDVRAAFRHAKLSLGWRMGDRRLLFSTLDEMQADAETPPVVRDIAQVFVDASHLSATPVSYSDLARRMQRMSRAQLAAGHTYYAAISLHNAATAESAAGHISEAIRLGEEALLAYDALTFRPAETFSTHSLLATCWYELGVMPRADRHLALALESGEEHGDVHAEAAYISVLMGRYQRAEGFLRSGDALGRQGRSDLQAVATSLLTRALMAVPTDPELALDLVDRIQVDRPLDVGATLARDGIAALGHLMAGRIRKAHELAVASLDRARQHEARNSEVRLALVAAVASESSAAIRAAVFDARCVGALALLEMADGLGRVLHLVEGSPEIAESIGRWPERWLPILRRELLTGMTPSSRAAAQLLDDHGQAQDVVRLRAYAKTYGGRSRSTMALGRALARRVGPILEVNDLGRVILKIDDRSYPLSKVRRKSAALLMFLATRPNLTATREQVLDELWPESEPQSAANSLSQTLFFLRRDIDPWHEDDMSADYVHYEGELVWLDAELVRMASAQFLEAIQHARRPPMEVDSVSRLLEAYSGRFAPEFEYEEWAIAWRSRLHAAYLEFAVFAIDWFITERSLAQARDAAIKVFEVDPTAADIERRLIWIYWHLGARSAAEAQYHHFASQERADGLDPTPLKTLTQDKYDP